MKLSKASRNRLEALAHEEYRRQFPQPVRRDPPETHNAEEAQAINRPVVFSYRGRPFVLDPIPVEDGIALHELHMRILAPQSVDDYREACRDALAMMGSLARRRGWRGRCGRVLPNPFRKASEQEVRELLDFFFKCRTGIRFRDWVDRMIGLVERTGSVASTPSRPNTSASRRAGATTSTA